MHNLVIDIGNTNSKLAVFSEKELVHYQRTGVLTLDHLKEVIAAFPLQNFTVSSVSTVHTALIEWLSEQLQYVPFSTAFTAGIINHYQTLSTLGLDRWAKIIAVHRFFPKSNCLVIDAGTCITYDVLNAQSEYFGGSISLGIHMRFNALQYYTGRLPLVEWDREAGIPEGNDTENAIRNGVLQGVINEVTGFIGLENKKNKDLRVVLTGGDANFLMEQLKNSIFASQITLDPYLVVKGLNEVICIKN